MIKKQREDEAFLPFLITFPWTLAYSQLDLTRLLLRFGTWLWSCLWPPVGTEFDWSITYKFFFLLTVKCLANI